MARNLEQLQKQYNSLAPAKGGMMGGPRGGGPGGHGRGAHGKPKNSKNTIKRLLKYISVYKFRFIFVFLCLIISTITSLLGSYLLSPIIDKLANVRVSDNKIGNRIITAVCDAISPLIEPFVGSGKTADIISYLITGIICLAAVYIVAAICTYAQSKIMLHISQGAISNIRKDLFDKVQTLPVRFHDSHATGEIMSRFTNDVDNIGMMLDTSVVSLVSGAFTLVGTLFFMLYTNVLLSVITLLFVPLYALGGSAIAKKSQKYYSAQQAALGAVNGYIEESVTGQKVVKVFNHEDECIEEFGLLNNHLRDKQMYAQFYGGIMGPVMGNLSKLCYALIAGIGGILCFLTLTGEIATSSVLALSVGGLTIFVNYANQFSRPISEVSNQMTTIFSALAGAERVFGIMDTDSEEPDCEGAKDINNIKGDVVLENVTFGYKSDKTVLKDISLWAKAGQKIAFVGSTGAGKTTITNLLNRFYDISEGKITIDGIDIKDFKREELRKNIAMVLQDTHLFSGTVMENIRYGRLDATDDEVIAAAKVASAHSFIMRLSDGYNTILEGDGSNLSQGQRQLINIARASLSKAPILVLDEATSSVDTRTERHIEHGMDRLMENRTTFVIAHRLSTVRNSNAIMVLEDGVIIERGDHDDLIKQKGRYYELYTGVKELD